MPNASIGVSGASTANNPALTRAVNIGTTTSGSTIIVFVGYDSSGSALAATPVDDNMSNTFTEVPKGVVTFGSNNSTRCYYNANGTRGAGHTITMHLTIASFAAMMIVEVKDAHVSAPIDINDCQADTTTPYVSPSATNAEANEVLVGAIFCDESGVSYSDTYGGSFSSGDELASQANGTDLVGSIAAKVIFPITTYQTSVTISGVTVNSTGVWLVSVKGVPGTTSIDVSRAAVVVIGYDLTLDAPTQPPVRADFSEFPKDPIRTYARGLQ